MMSMYPDEFVVTDERTWSLTLDACSLTITLPDGYPSEAPPHVTLSRPPGLGRARLREEASLRAALRAAWADRRDVVVSEIPACAPARSRRLAPGPPPLAAAAAAPRPRMSGVALVARSRAQARAVREGARGPRARAPVGGRLITADDRRGGGAPRWRRRRCRRATRRSCSRAAQRLRLFSRACALRMSTSSPRTSLLTPGDWARSLASRAARHRRRRWCGGSRWRRAHRAHDVASWERLYDTLGLFDDETRGACWPAWRPPVPPTAARRSSAQPLP